MKIVRVIYTTTTEFASRNVENINNVTNEVRKLNHPGIKYSCFLMADGKTFMHFDQFENEAAHQVLTDLKSFKMFAEELEASGLESEPKLELLSLVSSSENLFEEI